MEFSFSAANSNLESINKFLTAKGITLSNEERAQLKSIFILADKSVYKENEKGYNDGELDFFEQSFFKEKVKELFPKIKDKIGEFFVEINNTNLKDRIPPAQADATRVKKPENIDIENSARNAKANINKQEIIMKLSAKWSKIFSKSPLKLDFYEKLYDIIDTLHCSIKESNFNAAKYSSLKEQTMDEVIAIFAGEAQLNPKCVNRIYYGLFQLGASGLQSAKSWAKRNSEIREIKNITNNITISQFGQLSGSKQLDYLVAYIGQCKEYSHIAKDESITPAQLWSMIKYPSKGKDARLTKAKSDSIKRVFNNNKVPYGLH